MRFRLTPRKVEDALYVAFRELDPNAYLTDGESNFIDLNGRYEMRRLATILIRELDGE